jgi:two-component system sensor histidine kinase/response regulator
MSVQAPAGPELADASRMKPVVLIVDDRSENLLALEAVLEPLHVQVERATSGEDALRRLLSEQPDEITVIILDVQMPGMDGFETAERIRARERNRHIPIIFLTAISTEMTHALRGYETGAVDYVAKPFEPDVLRAKVAVLIELRQHARTIEEQRLLLAQRLDELDRAQATLNRQAVELERSNAELERFATLLSTELRGPMHHIAGFLDLLRTMYGTALGDGGALLDKAADATERLFDSVEQLMAYATVTTEMYHPGRTDLDEVVHDVRRSFQSRLEESHATLTSDPLPEVTGDRWQLLRLFTHLVDNALTHTREGVDIHIGLSRRDESWVLSVRDDGPGLPEPALPGLFTLLGRSVPTTDRSGERNHPRVGLPIARHIVERHGGTIWADSVAGQGTTISFTLPAGGEVPSPWD